jgi:predicted DNA-binding protein (UPF0251 family)
VETISLSRDELDALRLADLEGLYLVLLSISKFETE